jgi:hypothetical protein
MSDINDGGPAFPTDHSNTTEYTDIKGGMSLRDYFAGQALVGLLGNPDRTIKQQQTDGMAELAMQAYAISAYRFADEMLKVREAK